MDIAVLYQNTRQRKLVHTSAPNSKRNLHDAGGAVRPPRRSASMRPFASRLGSFSDAVRPPKRSASLQPSSRSSLTTKVTTRSSSSSRIDATGIISGTVRPPKRTSSLGPSPVAPLRPLSDSSLKPSSISSLKSDSTKASSTSSFRSDSVSSTNDRPRQPKRSSFLQPKGRSSLQPSSKKSLLLDSRHATYGTVRPPKRSLSLRPSSSAAFTRSDSSSAGTDTVKSPKRSVSLPTPTRRSSSARSLLQDDSTKRPSIHFAAVPHDQDVWFERFYMNSKMQPITYFRSLQTNQCFRGEPPTGATTIIYLDDIMEEDETECDDDTNNDDDANRVPSALKNFVFTPLEGNLIDLIQPTPSASSSSKKKKKGWRHVFGIRRKEKKQTQQKEKKQRVARDSSTPIGFGSTVVLPRRKPNESENGSKQQ